MPAGRRLRMACPLTTGASGGPWLEEFDPATGCGYIDGVTTNTDLANTTLWSPPFDDGVWVLYRFADRLQGHGVQPETWRAGVTEPT
jgi:hypothetical protein